MNTSQLVAYLANALPEISAPRKLPALSKNTANVRHGSARVADKALLLLLSSSSVSSSATSIDR